jgi:hypothetical protein
MGCDSDVAAAGRQRGPWYMSRAVTQDSGVIALEDHHGYLQARNIELADDVAAVHGLRRR